MRKKILKITGFTFLGLLMVLYLAFLFILPKSINLNPYKSDLQKLVKESTDLDIDFDKVEVITSPFLEAGLKTSNITVKLPDKSTLFSADSFKGKVFLPSLLWLSVRVTCAKVESPKLNVEIVDGEQYKVARVYENLVNKQRQERKLHPTEIKETESLPFDPSIIKLTIPALTLNNYSANIDDVKANHKLVLKGEQIKLGYFNGKVAKLKTDAQFLSDEDKNIVANLDIDTFIPAFTAQAQETQDDDEVFSLPFINPVSAYRDYNLKSNINSKIKIRKDKKSEKFWAKGFFNIEDTTLNLSGLQLPKSYFRLAANGYKASVDTNLYVTENEYIKILSEIKYNKNPKLDLSVKSTQVHFDNLLKITKAYLDTVHIKNDIKNMKASGYFLSNFDLKTDFDSVTSNGKFVVRGGNIEHKAVGLLFNAINSDVNFANNSIEISNTKVLINNHPLTISGKVNSDVTNINIDADRIPIAQLYKAFAPAEVKSQFNLNSGSLSLKTRIAGEIKALTALGKVDLENFNLSDCANNYVISNKLMHLGIVNLSGNIKGRFRNEGLKLSLLNANSTLSDEKIVADIDSKNIILNESILKFNKKSQIKFSGKVENYLTSANSKILADGSLADVDIKDFLGQDLSIYLKSQGSIPVKAEFKSEGSKMRFVSQLRTNANAYITPVEISELRGKELLWQFFADYNGDNLKINKTGLYIKKQNSLFNDSLNLNFLNSKEVIGFKAIVSNLKTTPFINLLKLNIPKDLTGTICIFPKSTFVSGGSLYSFGKLENPKITGNFYLKNLSIPELYTKVRETNINLSGKNVKIDVKDADVKDSDFNVALSSNWDNLAKTIFLDSKVTSKNIDVDKLLTVVDALDKNLPKVETSSSTTSGAANIPVSILNGTINLANITTGNLLIKNTTGNIALLDNIFYINDMKTYPLGGKVNGDVSVDLIDTMVKAVLRGKDFDMEKVLLDTMDMKDTLSGKLDFVTDISLKGATVEEQMQTLSGWLDFNVKNGQLGPFGKFENFLMAENIRENAFFSSTIGSIITNIVTFDTSRFNSLYGHLTFKDGFADVAPIKSQGNVMALYIAGKVGLLDNSADLKVRGKLASAFSDKLGALANLNPINLVKNTPGLNVVLAKTFSIFCESVSQEEMDALPALGEGKSDDYATKFQIVLRGDTRKPLKMIKSFKWLALNSQIESAKDFVDTIPTPDEGEENLSVEELLKLREEQALNAEKEQQAKEAEAQVQAQKTFLGRLKSKFAKSNK